MPLLPGNILSDVFDILPIDVLLPCGRTCAEWRRTVESKPQYHAHMMALTLASEIIPDDGPGEVFLVWENGCGNPRACLFVLRRALEEWWDRDNRILDVRVDVDGGKDCYYVRLLRTAGTCLRIFTINVPEAWRRRGLCRQTIQAVSAWAAGRAGVRGLLLGPVVEPAMHKVMESNGIKEDWRPRPWSFDYHCPQLY